MINVSNEFKQYILNDERNYLNYIDITLHDGTKVPRITNSKIWEGSLKIEDSVSSGDNFDIGSAMIGKLSFTLNNIYNEFSEYDFEGAVVRYQIGLELSNGRMEMFQKGIYMVDESTYTDSFITLECLDYMSKFDRAYSESKLTYPATLGEIVRDACTCCSVSLGTATFEKDDYIVKERPVDDALTFRQVLLWAAQLSCHWAKCNTWGELVLNWYDRSVFAQDVPKEGKYHHITSISSQDIFTSDVIITGVSVTGTGESENSIYLSGEEGYVLGIEGNKLIPSGEEQPVADYLGGKLNGMRFQPLSVECLSDPSMEVGDCAVVLDRKGRECRCYITNTTFVVGNYQSISCGAQTPSRNSAARYSQASQTYVEYRELVEKERTQRKLAIEKLAESMKDAGGLFMTVEEQQDGSHIYYAHNKPLLGESDIIWKFTVEAIGISLDGGETWPYGFMINGEMILKILQTEGIHADWINTGAISVKDQDGREMFYVNVDTGVVRINAESLSIKGKSVETMINDQSNEINAVYEYAHSEFTQLPEVIRAGVSELTYLKADIDTLIEEQSTAFEETSKDFTFSFNELKKDMDEMKDGTNSGFKEIHKYIRFVDGKILLGEEGNELMLEIDKEKISFLQNSVEVAYFSNRKMYVTDGEYTNSLMLGNFSFIPRENGNLSFLKVR